MVSTLIKVNVNKFNRNMKTTFTVNLNTNVKEWYSDAVFIQTLEELPSACYDGTFPLPKGNQWTINGYHSRKTLAKTFGLKAMIRGIKYSEK